MSEENKEAAETSAEPKVEEAPQEPAAKAGGDKKYASFGIRFVAILIDGVILGIVERILGASTSTIIAWLYYTVMTVMYGATLGKMVMGIKVVKEDGSAIDWTTGILREIVGKTVSAIILGIGFLMAAFDSKSKALHDKIAKTYVVYGKTSLSKK